MHFDSGTKNGRGLRVTSFLNCHDQILSQTFGKVLRPSAPSAVRYPHQCLQWLNSEACRSHITVPQLHLIPLKHPKVHSLYFNQPANAAGPSL
jgi:hypothetical protein